MPESEPGLEELKAAFAEQETVTFKELIEFFERNGQAFPALSAFFADSVMRELGYEPYGIPTWVKSERFGIIPSVPKPIGYRQQST